jgi:hypothetical protein
LKKIVKKQGRFFFWGGDNVFVCLSIIKLTGFFLEFDNKMEWKLAFVYSIHKRDYPHFYLCRQRAEQDAKKGDDVCKQVVAFFSDTQFYFLDYGQCGVLSPSYCDEDECFFFTLPNRHKCLECCRRLGLDPG